MRINTILKLSLLLWSFSLSAYNQEDPPTLFDSKELLNISLCTNFDSLMSDISEERKKHSGLLIHNHDTISVKLKTRGNFRRKSENCNFPPIKVYFKRKENDQSEFCHLKNLKLVTHCQNADSDYQNKLIIEYLSYKAYNIISDFSLKARLADIKYTDLNKGLKQQNKGFFIERDKDFAKRFNSKLIELTNVYLDSVDTYSMHVASLFQFMIGNSDWSIQVGHNIKFIHPEGFDKMIPIPYDFDWSGLMNMPYRVNPVTNQNEEFPMPFFKGRKPTRKELKPVIKYFNTKKREIIDLFDSNPYLPKKEKEYCIRYIKRFYRLINNPLKHRQVFWN